MPFGLRTRQNRQAQQTQARTTPKALKLTVPENIVPGQRTFQITVGGRNLRVSCPHDVRPGGSMRVIVPKYASSPRGMPVHCSNILKTDVPNVFFVAIPDTAQEGEYFAVTIEGQTLHIERPHGAENGTILKIAVASSRGQDQPQLTSSSESISEDDDGQQESHSHSHHRRASSNQRPKNSNAIVVAVVPEGVVAGQDFTVVLHGVSIPVVCPPDAPPGTIIKVKIGTQELDYGRGHGWVRSLQIKDMKFRWVHRRNDDEMKSAAFVRNLEMLPASGYNMNIPGGRLSFVPAEETAVTSLVPADAGPPPLSPDAPKNFVVTWINTTRVQKGTLKQKTAWFHNTCSKRFRIAEKRHIISLDIRRGTGLLGDSVDAIMGMSQENLRKSWRICFIGEDGIDEGGLTRDWFQLISKELFDPNKGLWQSSVADQMRMEINAASGAFCENHLMYFRFMGRMMGRALFDNQLIAGHMARYLYKHILGFPITLEDLKDVDEVYYNSLTQLDIMGREGISINGKCQRDNCEPLD